VGYFSNLSVDIIEEYERLQNNFPHPARISFVAKLYNISEAEVEAVICPWIDGDYDYLND